MEGEEAAHTGCLVTVVAESCWWVVDSGCQGQLAHLLLPGAAGLTGVLEAPLAAVRCWMSGVWEVSLQLLLTGWVECRW